ncbi:MAG TPA: HAD family hydrolase [candidate division Zixibacteria bacterium]|nr:HAD family hydrolase [candidate division Zixibacteria bacterium]
MIAFFDLEGPLCPIDHSAEIIEQIGKKLGKEEDFYQLFQMISVYDDELFLVDKKENYWPGDTLKLIAPIVVSYANEEELVNISKKALLTPGAKELFDYLHLNKIPTYIISTSYTQHAYTIAQKLEHPIDNVRCTKLDFSLKSDSSEILKVLFDDIFPRYLQEGLQNVKKDLDQFFFKEIPNSNLGPIFESTIVCGGGRKRESVIEILKEHSSDVKQAIAVGDSITDIQMLEYVKDGGGTAISFNGNLHSLKPASIAFSGNSILPLKEIFENFPKSLEHIKNLDIEKQSNKEENFHLVQGITKEDFEKVLLLQKKYRKILREKASNLT